MTNPRTLHLSTSAVTAFKACPTRFDYGYIEGIRADTDTESQRVGTNWHKMHETYRNSQNSTVPGADGECFDPFEDAIRELNRIYENIPDSFDAYAWEIERTILAMSFSAHCWYYKDDQVETLATEVGFKLPLHHPKTGLPLSLDDVIRIGRIDRIVRYQGRISIADYKSTTKSIDPDSDFWNHLRLDSQISMYGLAAREMAQQGMLSEYGISPTNEVAGAFYDVWHRPTIKPSKLTQAETAEFIKTGMYMEQRFHVEMGFTQKTCNPPIEIREVAVNRTMCEVEEGKKGFSIRETPEMFGARLLADIYARPTFYFHRKEIPRTDADLRRFRGQLYATYQSMKAARDSGHWIENEHQCNATYRCPYTSICWHGVDVRHGQTPAGYKRIFTDLTVGGENVEI